MKYTVIAGRELTPTLCRRWSAILASNVSLGSPYFRPEFTRCVAAVRDDVFIGVLEDCGRPVGFFPFHRRRGGVARPIGLGLSDYHGVIAERGAEWTAAELLKGCSLVRYEFDHLLASQSQFAADHRKLAGSPVIDVSGGYDAYLAARDSAGRKQIRETQRKLGRLQADVGPVRFTQQSGDPEVLDTLMRWKSDQCQRTGTVDYFALPWCVELIRRIHAAQQPDFAGVLSCLHVNDTLIAAHFAMRSGAVLHSWFPVYSHQYQQYSPGMMLLLEVVRSAAEHGIESIDLGKGMSLYKRRFMSHSIEVAEGCSELPAFINHVKHLCELAERWGRASALKPVLRLPGRVFKKLEREGRYD